MFWEEQILMDEEKIDRILEEAKKDKKNIVIELSNGLFEEVYNLPKGYTYTLVDRDYLKEQDEMEFKEFMDELKRDSNNF